MPVLVDPKSCVDRDHCFAAGACPYDAFIHNPLKRTWEVDATVCGDCPGPCLNFCDKDALRWGDDLVDLKLVKAELEGKMKPAEVAEARLKHKEEAKAALEAAKKKSAEGVIDLTRANFEREVLRSQAPVVVDCWADWCAPCKQFSPIFEATAKQYVGVVKFAKLDTESEKALAAGLGVQALPTILMFYKGQLVNAVEGALPVSQFQQWIYQTLAAIRQYEAQLQAESEDAITSASQNLSSLDGAPEPELTQPQAPTSTPGSSVILDSKATTDSPPPQRTPPEPRGKQTSSGLFIP
ncbi:MAG TPA: thioredoxin [Chloroflexia bacterium]|nr:thioredoxin [Chloroflexia bacterium]